MMERKKNIKKSAPVKGGAAANPQVAAVVASHKDDTAVMETAPEAEKAEGEVKADEEMEEMKVEETIAEQNEESTIQVDPEFNQEQLRAARKSSLRLRFHDNPADLMTSDLSDEDREIIAELIVEQGQVVVEYSATTERLNQDKDALERKLDATNSRLGNVSKFISATVTETVGQMGKETSAAIDGLNATVLENIGRQNGVKNAVTKIGDDVSKDIAGLKGRLDGIKSNPSFSHWPWVTVIGGILLVILLLGIFFLSKETKIEVQVLPQPAAGTVKNVVPPTGGEVTSQQATVGGPSNPLVPSIIIGANPADPCEGLTGKANGECAMNQRRPKDFPDQDWNTVLTVFAEPASVGLEGGLEACREKYLRATDNEDFALECEAAVKCLVSPEEKRRDCWRIAAESFEHKLGMTN